jgi:uncharacterized membrane protein
MLRSVLAILSTLVILAGCTDAAVLAPDAGSPLLAKGGVKGPPGGGEDPEPGNYTLTDLGPGWAAGVSDAGIVVGTSDLGPTLWTPGPKVEPVPMGGFGAEGWVNGINSTGTWAIGGLWNDLTGQQATRWKLDDEDVLPGVTLPPLAGYDEASASGVNNEGQVVGSSWITDESLSQQATLWGVDQTSRVLPGLPGSTGSLAWGMNDSGHIVGKSLIASTGPRPLLTRAVLWIVDGGTITTIDLTDGGLTDDTGDNQATHVGEVHSGEIEITGTSFLGGERMGTIWTVNAATGARVAVLRPIPVGGTPSAINGQGEVLLTGPPRIWDRIAETTEELPALSKCGGRWARGLNEGGTVVGESRIKVKGKAQVQCATRHAVIWTKKP